MRISIYGGTQETHHRITGNPISLAKIKDNILKLKAARDAAQSSSPYIYMKMIESKNPIENASFLSEFEGVGDEIVLEPVMNWNDPSEGNLAGVSDDQLLDSKYFAAKKHACTFPFYTLIIHSDLNVSVCCVDWNKKVLVGNLREQSLQEVWQGERLRDFQMMHLQHRRADIEGCRHCTFLHTAPDNINALAPTTFMSRWEKKYSN